MAFSSDGVTLATGSRDGMVTLWDVAAQQDISTFKVHTAEDHFCIIFKRWGNPRYRLTGWDG